MIQPVFLFGPFCDPSFLRDVVGEDAPKAGAVLDDYALCGVDQSLMPVLVARSGAAVEGVIAGLDADARARLDVFFAVMGAKPVQVVPRLDQTQTEALTYSLAAHMQCHAAPEWSGTQAAVMRRACTEIMELADAFSAEALQARWPMALAHAASTLRAQADDNPARQRNAWDRHDVEVAQARRPYAWYFSVAEDDLRFRQFGGGFSAVVKRAGFVMCDAVTVLPYDPVRDVVMVIEQFRFGPWLRGARNAWLLEPVAGRVDPFETPEDCALRETQEEAQLTLRKDRLLSIGNVYPSPGAITEFLYQYVALTDLPDGAEGVSGMDSEAEDIRSHIIPFTRLMALIQSGEVANGPLVQSAYWLALNRERLRADAAAQAGG